MQSKKPQTETRIPPAVPFPNTKPVLLKKKSRLRLWLLLTVVLAAALAAAFFYWQSQNSSKAANQRVVEVRRSTIDIKVTATGVIRPYKQVKVSPKQGGLISQLFVKQGDFIEKGQPIAKMDDTQLQAQLSAARAAYLTAQDNYNKAKTGNRPQEIAAAAFQALRSEKGATSAEQNLKRLKLQIKSLEAQSFRDAQNAKRQAFLAQNGAISDQDRLNAVTTSQVTQTQLEMAKQELVTAESAVAQAHAEADAAKQQHEMLAIGNRSEDISAAMHNMMQSQANMKQIQTQINDTLVKAPFDGVVTQKYADEGAFVTPTTSSATNSATSSSIVTLASALEMVAQVSEADVSKIKIGQQVEIMANALPGKVFNGKVTDIAPEAIVTSNVTTFEVHVGLEEQRHLLSGMNVSARFVAGQEKDALTVPNVAILSRRGESGVLVQTKGEPEFRKVELGPSVGNRVVVRAGLKEGDKVVLGLDKDQMGSFGYGGRSGGGGGFRGGAGGLGMPRFGGGGRGGR